MSFAKGTDPTPESRAASLEIRRAYRSGEIPFDDAINRLNDLLKDAKKRRHVADQINLLNITGILYSLQGRTNESLNSYRQALTLAKILGDDVQAVRITMNMGETYRRKGEYKEALKHYNQAHITSSSLTQWTVVPAGSLLNMGETLYEMGQYSDSLDKLNEAVERIMATWPVDDATRNPALCEAYTYLGHSHLQLSDLDEALKSAAKAYEFASMTTDHEGLGLVHRLYGEIYSRYAQPPTPPVTTSDPDEHYAKAIEHFKAMNLAPELAKTHYMQAESRRQRKIKAGTDEGYLEAITIFGRLGMSKQLTMALEARVKYGLESK